MSEIIRTYILKDFSNLSKLNKIVDVIHVYRKTAKQISNKHWFLFYSEANKFNKNLNIKSIYSKLSERYKQTCQYQVVGMLNSYISNIKLRYINTVLNSSVDEDTRIKLLYINKYNKWFKKEVNMKNKLIDESILKISRRIFKNLTKNKPRCNNINLSLDTKVAKVSENTNTGSDFNYWINISTLDKGKPVMIPLKTNEYFNKVGGILKNSIQVNLKNNRPVFSLIKSIDIDKEYVVNECSKLGLDIGTVNLFATNHGDLLGKKIMKHLKNMDNIITRLSKNLRKQGIKPSQSKRYVKLNERLRTYLKNEINRILNKLVKRYKPKEINVENLDFKGSKIGKKNNRILNRFGKRYINNKLTTLSEEKNIKINKKNPAYTSQQCSNCNYTNSSNRVTRDNFKCGFCGLKISADVNSGKNLVTRCSSYNKIKRSKIFDELCKLHSTWKGQRGYSSTKDSGFIQKCPNLDINIC